MLKHSTAIVCFLGALLLESSAYAQTPSRGWFIDANYVNTQPDQGQQHYFTAVMFSATGFMTIDTFYPDMPRGHGFEMGGGYTFGAGVGAGVRWLRTRFDYSIDTRIDVRDPVSFGLIVFDSAESDEVHRTETAVDLMATYTLPIPRPGVQVRVFGGPTYFNVKQAMVSNVHFTSIFGLPQLPGVVSAVSIDTIETEDVDGGAWGYHFGGDVAYFFSRHVGVGGGLRYSEGKKIEAVPIPIDNPVAFDEEAELDTGYFTIAVGMRFRF